ncbi:hypothetical protein BDF19DRAFT_427224 [Syncephalis fuscata]|nr:hypothetical protein BDF19DRAFT_427224 [Syncephalis fuscata]
MFGASLPFNGQQQSPQSPFHPQPAPVMNANQMMQRHSWMPQMGRPASPYFSPANANTYRQRNLSEPILRTCPTGNPSLMVPGQGMSTPSNGTSNDSTHRQNMNTLTISEGEEEEAEKTTLMNQLNEDDDDVYSTEEGSEEEEDEESDDEDEQPLGNQLLFAHHEHNQNDSKSSLISTGSTKDRPMPSRSILKASGIGTSPEMARMPSSPAPWTNRNSSYKNDSSSNEVTSSASELSVLDVTRSQSGSSSSTLSNEEAESSVSTSSSASSSCEALLTPASSSTAVSTVNEADGPLKVSSSTLSNNDEDISGSGSGSDMTTTLQTSSQPPPPQLHNNNNSTTSKSMVVVVVDKEPKRFRFNERVLVGETWPATEYDRRGESIIRLTPALAQAIKMELNEFKAKEMAVHEDSRIYTHLLA